MSIKLVLRFRKGDPDILSCRRADGTGTWTRLPPGMVAHDLAHYAVETVLDCHRAFHGLLARGADIADFELTGGQRPEALLPANLPAEALQTEHIVNLLLVGVQGGLEPGTLLSQLRSILKDSGLPYPENLNKEVLGRIQSRLAQLLARWKQTPPEGSLELVFPGDA